MRLRCRELAIGAGVRGRVREGRRGERDAGADQPLRLLQGAGQTIRVDPSRS